MINIIAMHVRVRIMIGPDKPGGISVEDYVRFGITGLPCSFKGDDSMRVILVALNKFQILIL